LPSLVMLCSRRNSNQIFVKEVESCQVDSGRGGYAALLYIVYDIKKTNPTNIY